MNLNDDELEYAFTGIDFTNIGNEDSCLYDFSNLLIEFKGIIKTEDDDGAESIVARLFVYNYRKTDTWLCYSMLLNDENNYFDDFIILEANKEQEIEIWIEDYDIAYSNNRRACIHFILEDGRRRILGRCNSICVEYNIFAGRYRYFKIEKFTKGEGRAFRELDIRVNKLTGRRYINWERAYEYRLDTLPIIITNCTNRRRAFLIDYLEFNGETPTEIKGLNDINDAISIGDWESKEIEIVISSEDVYTGAALLLFLVDLATNNRYINVYTYDASTHRCSIDYTAVFTHDSF